MSELFGNPNAGSINGHGKSAISPECDGKSAVDDGDWFAELARSLLPSKAGTALHYITGFDERICQRYAAGHVKPPAYFLRTLLRSKQGWQFLSGAMEGSDAPWWIEVNEALRIKQAVDGIRK
jgi:hypothetical protein